jgi:hypothetical protein
MDSGRLVFNTTGNVKQAQTWLGHSSNRFTSARPSRNQITSVSFQLSAISDQL